MDTMTFATYNEETECVGGIGNSESEAWTDHNKYCDGRSGYLLCVTTEELHEKLIRDGGIGILIMFDEKNHYLEIA